MTFQQLRIFAAIARRRNVTKASAELHLTQPAVTHQMKLFQDEVGALYERTPQGIDLTGTGRMLLRAIAPVLRDLDGIAAKFGRRPLGKTIPRLVIGGSNGPTAWFLPSLLSRFRELSSRLQQRPQRAEPCKA